MLSLSAAASAQAPIPVVERVFTEGEIATRVTLFSNRVVVVSIAENGVQGYFKHIDSAAGPVSDLPRDSAEERSKSLGEKPVTSAVSTPRSQVALTLHIGPDSPRKIEFSPMATVSLPLAQISGRHQRPRTSWFASRARPPKISRVGIPDAATGSNSWTESYARVAEVLDDGFLVLEHEDTYIREIVGPDVRDEVILRVVEREK